jgi:hypothetical protein
MGRAPNKELDFLTTFGTVFCEVLSAEAGISDASRHDCYSAIVDYTHRPVSYEELKSWGEREYAQAAIAFNKYFETTRVAPSHVSKA